MQERAKLWEIKKMELRSQADFTREERARQRKLDSFDCAIQQIDKEVLAGRMTEDEAKPFKLKYEIEKMGVDVPVSLLPKGDEEDKFGIPPWYESPEWKDTPEGKAARAKAYPGDDEDRYGIEPYWRKFLAPEYEDTPERDLALSKMKEQISGERKGTIPYYLDPEYMRENRAAAKAAQRARNIFLSNDEFDAMIKREKERLPLGDKQLDVGTRKETKLPTDRAVNRATGERLVSYDNQETWEPAPVEEEITRKPTKPPSAEVGRYPAGYKQFRGFYY